MYMKRYYVKQMLVDNYSNRHTMMYSGGIVNEYIHDMSIGRTYDVDNGAYGVIDIALGNNGVHSTSIRGMHKVLLPVRNNLSISNNRLRTRGKVLMARVVGLHTRTSYPKSVLGRLIAIGPKLGIIRYKSYIARKWKRSISISSRYKLSCNWLGKLVMVRGCSRSIDGVLYTLVKQHKPMNIRRAYIIKQRRMRNVCIGYKVVC
jgi:hypothetical protein